MRVAVLCLSVVALLSGCIMLDVKSIPAGERAGNRYVTLQPLALYGAYGKYPDKTITWYFLTSIGIANRYHTEIDAVPRGTEVEIVDLLDRSAFGVPHSVILRVRLRPGVGGSFPGDLVQVSESRLLEKSPDGTPELNGDFFRRLD